MYLEKINRPEDVKPLEIEEMTTLASEIRAGILNRVSNIGGHVGPNLGITEAVIAMAKVFSFLTDKVVWDVSHQVYPWKMLTGRAFGYTDNSRFNEVSGYSSPSESAVYDQFEIGHTSTSVALASGLQKARDMHGEHFNVIAVIGDGSLSGGEAFEGLDVAAELGTNIIVVVNDNEMSIAENHGGIYQNLQLLRESQGTAECNLFRAMGFDYVYLEQGNDIAALISVFNKVRNIDHPVVVHIHTEKGHGYAPAVADKEAFHWSMPFKLETSYNGRINLAPTDGSTPDDSTLNDRTPDNLKTSQPQDLITPQEYFPAMAGNYLRSLMDNDPLIVAVASAVPAAIGFNRELRKKYGRQFIDVGIAEEEAVALISGMAKGGCRPVWSTYATFIQRTYDQLAQDLCVNSNPAVINVIGSSVYGMNDITHLCFFDIPMLSHIPNLVYLAPTTYEEFCAMEKWAIYQTQYPVAIRVPEHCVVHSDEAYDDDYSRIDTYKITHKGERVAVTAAGGFYQKGERVVNELAKHGITATLINPRYLSGVDCEALNSLKADHQLVVTLEDGSIDGGFGERICRYYGASSMRVLSFGVRKALYDRYDVNQVLNDNHLQDNQIVEDILKVLE